MSSNVAAAGTLAGNRRWIFSGFNLVLLGLVAWPMAMRLSKTGWTVTGVILFALFLFLLAQVVYGFTLAVTGWWLIRHGGDPVRVNLTLPPDGGAGELPATAIVMPIYNEDVSRVFQGIRVMYESLEKTGKGGTFDFFILSDTTDPNHWIAEEKAWFDLCQQVRGFGRIYYRKRHHQQHNKSGNIADFCRRWGTKYQCMIVLDADSVMSGPTFVRLASLMEHNPRAGIIQTTTKIALGRSLFQRINQFACHAYLPLFVAGTNYWQLDSANYYGHNAIIRIKPFMQYCAMPELPQASPLGRRILSHDTVEAAFMRRAGHEVWSDYDLGGSYEESPPHLLASLQRDRRWCHGNLQHLWLLFAPGLAGPSRLNILIGIMAYASSPLWLLFLGLSAWVFAGNHFNAEAGLVFACVMGLLLLPKFLAASLLSTSSEPVNAAGGRIRIFMNVIAETISSMVLAPILMLFYTQFVWASFFGTAIGWGRQKRSDDAGPSWGDLAAVHLGYTLIAILLGVLAAWRAPAILPGLLMVLIGPIVAIPFSRLLASNRLGLASQRRGWFLVPEETLPPWELQQMFKATEPPVNPNSSTLDHAPDFGLLQAVLDPYLNAIHVSLLREKSHVSLRTYEQMNMMTDRLLLEGPLALTLMEKRMLLWDADAMLALHQKLWCSPATYLHEWWQKAFQVYNEANARKILHRSP
jgi:membrane glycosyltransferase